MGLGEVEGTVSCSSQHKAPPPLQAVFGERAFDRLLSLTRHLLLSVNPEETCPGLGKAACTQALTPALPRTAGSGTREQPLGREGTQSPGGGSRSPKCTAETDRVWGGRTQEVTDAERAW